MEMVTYELTFPDSKENRLRIMRFLLGGYFPEVPRSEMLAAFDPHRVAGNISMHISHRHFIVWKNATSRPANPGTIEKAIP